MFLVPLPVPVPALTTGPHASHSYSPPPPTMTPELLAPQQASTPVHPPPRARATPVAMGVTETPHRTLGCGVALGPPAREGALLGKVP